MTRTILAIAALLAVQPVFGWELSSSDTKKTWTYSAYQADKSGGVELQFYCDSDYPDDITMLVFTDQDARPGDSEFPSISVDAVADDLKLTDLSGYYDEVDGERTLVVDSPEDERVRDFLTAAQAAKRPLQVEFDTYSYRFGVDGISGALGDFIKGCER